ncbi:MAG: hypothetical protein AB7S77_09150 [Desulfatirhabdiaceae bacterium]
MKCYNCGGTYIQYHGDIRLFSEFIGDYDVKAVTYHKCSQCGELLFPDKTARIIESIENEIRNQKIANLQVKDFVSATEASKILGISKQAFSKHPRIKKGFIYSVSVGGKKLYHRDSVLRFKENGDGRFKLYCDPDNTPYQQSNVFFMDFQSNYAITSDDYLYEGTGNVRADC